MSPAKSTKPKTFVAARERLDAILEELERDAGDVDQLAARIREASELIRFCRERLSSARQEVKQVVAELEAEEQAEAVDSEPPVEVLDEEPPPAEAYDDGLGGNLPF